jgi:endogenous inhibitor of DNA gyrase (YacG/DUF329 family)
MEAAVENLTCHCPETGKSVELQFETDGASLARIWSSPVRFQCPHCGKEHETKVGAAFVENVVARASSRDAHAKR